MANIKSAKKRNRTNEIQRQRNASVKSRVKTYFKKATEAIESGDREQVAKILPEALSEIDTATRKGVLHVNTASRKKSILQRKSAALQ